MKHDLRARCGWYAGLLIVAMVGVGPTVHAETEFQGPPSAPSIKGFDPGAAIVGKPGELLATFCQTISSSLGNVPSSLSAATPTACEPGVPGVPDVAAAALHCSGGSTTILGWSDSVLVGGIPVLTQNGPASSYYEFDAVKKGDQWVIQSINGHTRSTLDDLSVTTVNKQILATWSFTSIPMTGTVSWGFNCLYNPLTMVGIITSVTVMLRGSPLVPSPLGVEAGGTTCLVPC